MESLWVHCGTTPRHRSSVAQRRSENTSPQQFVTIFQPAQTGLAALNTALTVAGLVRAAVLRAAFTGAGTDSIHGVEHGGPLLHVGPRKARS